MEAPSAKIILGCLVIGLIVFAILSYFEKQRLESDTEYNSFTIMLINSKCSVSAVICFLFLALNSYFRSIKKVAPTPVLSVDSLPPPPIASAPAASGAPPPPPEQTAASL